MPSKKKRIKNLKPTMRENTRYLSYLIYPEANYTSKDHQFILNNINKQLGVFDGADAGIKMIKFQNQKGIIRARADMVNKIKTTLMLTKSINANNKDKKNIMISTTKVSGLINKVKPELNH